MLHSNDSLTRVCKGLKTINLTLPPPDRDQQHRTVFFWGSAAVARPSSVAGKKTHKKPHKKQEKLHPGWGVNFRSHQAVGWSVDASYAKKKTGRGKGCASPAGRHGSAVRQDCPPYGRRRPEKGKLMSISRPICLGSSSANVPEHYQRCLCSSKRNHVNTKHTFATALLSK